jgi:hypothetical protein
MVKDFIYYGWGCANGCEKVEGGGDSSFFQIIVIRNGKGLTTGLRNRPYSCISTQRVR